MTTIHKEALTAKAPFKIYGVEKENGKFRRMPEDSARNCSGTGEDIG